MSLPQRGLRDKRPRRIIQCWERPPGERSNLVHPRYPEEWAIFALIDYAPSATLWQTEHPLFRLLSEEHRNELLGVARHQFSLDWEALPDLRSPGEIAHNLLGLASSSLSANEISKWNQFQTNHPKLVQCFWQTVAEASGQPPADLVVLVTDGCRTVRLSPKGIFLWKPGSSEPNPLPEVTAPEFLLVETAA